MGLGVLGGGVATTRWFLKRGDRVTVTDLRSRAKLAPSIRALGKGAKRVRFVLGRHRLADFRTNNIIVANPAVPRGSPYLAAARLAGKQVVNDAHIFLDEFEGPLIAVTGTRGKTTTVNWIAHLMRGAYPGLLAGGNSSADMPLLKLLDDSALAEGSPVIPAVVELSSWQLELVRGARRAPDVAVITNLYPDHLNRYHNIRAYAAAKANIFRDQTQDQALILNADDAWTPFFLKRKPRSRVFFISLKPLPKSKRGIYVNGGTVFARLTAGSTERVLSRAALATLASWGDHNIRNLLTTLLAGRLAGVSFRSLSTRLSSLPTVPLREEVIHQDRHLTVVNDSAGTSPDATTAALRRFQKSRIILLAGGTDKELTFGEWAKAVKHHVPPERLLLLEGSATKKMVVALRCIGYFRKSAPQVFTTLPAMVRAAWKPTTDPPRLTSGRVEAGNRQPTTILFSPGAASFEKFKNEFDRGRKFTAYCVRYFTEKKKEE
ncbi:MAG: UDP-N-acetylmuramoyl-L-alanine--D-glutamate ligase [bacterium]|nr:UDP-N-acetylmuramoyl-L-alanine--D-glutamate ligase [bacterium]